MLINAHKRGIERLLITKIVDFILFIIIITIIIIIIV